MWYPAPVEPRDGAPKGPPMARARSLTEFQKEFPDEASCAAFLFERRWPDGFVCPACGNPRAAALRSRAYTYEFHNRNYVHLHWCRLKVNDRPYEWQITSEPGRE